MRILYFGNNQHAWSTERYVQHALRMNGCEVELKNGKHHPLHSVQKLVKNYRPDVVLFSKATAPYFGKFLAWLKQKKIRTVCWQWDLFFGYRKRCPVQFESDLLFTTDGGHQNNWEKQYPHHQVLRQGIHAPDHVKYDRPYRFDVGFVGSIETAHRSRRQVFSLMQKKFGCKFTWINGCRGHDLNKRLAQVKVLIGDSYPSEGYWSNRIYEMLGRGAFFIHAKTEGMEEEFDDGTHFVSYERNNLDDLLTKIHFYIEEDEERERIRDNGFELMGKRFTYEHRCRILLDAIKASL